MRGRQMERVVVRPGIAGEQLVVLGCQTKSTGAGIGIEKCILIDGVDGAVKGGQRDRMGSGIEGLNGIARLSQMSTLGTDITNFEYPICGQLPLDAQVPLLRAGRDKVAGDFEAEEINAVVVERGTLRAVKGRRSRRAVDKSQELRIDRNKRRIDDATGGKPAGASGEDIGHVAGSSQRRGDGENRSGKGKLVYGADVFADVEDAVATADGRGVMAK